MSRTDRDRQRNTSSPRNENVCPAKDIPVTSDGNVKPCTVSISSLSYNEAAWLANKTWASKSAASRGSDLATRDKHGRGPGKASYEVRSSGDLG
ncbi:hypothetical protein AURDEDRAFT_171489 [Auricularia subglabra TFB-10046 SS5]|nr:hypothetical protein AURDEDRAFT_171489 [Auricularia subglabra TFB-10046 SS5]